MRKPQPFGRYLLMDRIAVGGMAEVFAAKTFGVEGFERLVAIKRILPTMVEDDEFVAMFIDEARIAARLSHATIAQIYELGRHEESYYIAMEYVAGRDVRLLIDKFRKRGEKVPLNVAAFITARMAEGLDYAHSKKDENGEPLHVIHRDISPQNILVSYDGEVKIIDFGIAKATGRNQKTQVGILKGKFAYMSPEQVRGIDIDHRSDIFSAGVMLYEMLTGSKLFTGESDFSTLEKVRAGDVRAPSELNPAIPPALEQIALKALAKERDERYQNGSALHDDLVRYLAREDEVFSTKSLANFLTATFQEELRKENERQRRWWSTTTEETVDFEPTRSSPAPTSRPRQAPKAPTTPQKVRIGEQPGAVPSDSTFVGSVESETTVSRPKSDSPEPELVEQQTQVRSVDLDGKTAIVSASDLASADLKRLPPPPVPNQGPLEIMPGVPAQQGTSAQPPPRKTGRLVLVALAALIVATFGAFVFGPLRPLPAVSLDVRARDGSALPHLIVAVDDQRLQGQPPYSLHEARGTHRLHAEAAGFISVDRGFAVPDEKNLDVRLTAVPAPEVPDAGPPALVPETAAAGVDAGVAAPSGGGGHEPRGGEEAPRGGHRKTGQDVITALGALDAGTPKRDEGEKVKDTTPTPATTGPGTLVLETKPPGALFRVNGKGKPSQRTPYTLKDLEPGPVIIQFMLSGYQRKEKTIDVKPGETQQVIVDLDPVGGGPDSAPDAGSGEAATTASAESAGPASTTGTIKVLCIPISSVFVDGKPTNMRTTTHAIPIEVPVGHHVVTCQSDQGKSSPPQDCDITPGSVCEYRKRVQ
jgi:serine/threonine protein kinase